MQAVQEKGEESSTDGGRNVHNLPSQLKGCVPTQCEEGRKGGEGKEGKKGGKEEEKERKEGGEGRKGREGGKKVR